MSAPAGRVPLPQLDVVWAVPVGRTLVYREPRPFAGKLACPADYNKLVPQDLVNRLNTEIGRALAAPDVRDRLAQVGLDWKANTPGEFTAFLRDEVKKWAQAVKDSGAKAD